MKSRLRYRRTILACSAGCRTDRQMVRVVADATMCWRDEVLRAGAVCYARACRYAVRRMLAMTRRRRARGTDVIRSMLSVSDISHVVALGRLNAAAAVVLIQTPDVKYDWLTFHGSVRTIGGTAYNENTSGGMWPLPAGALTGRRM